jgi:hypothetical protein
LGVWTKPGNRSPVYLSSLTDGLSAHRQFIESAPTVIVGDLNVYWLEKNEPFKRYDNGAVNRLGFSGDSVM